MSAESGESASWPFTIGRVLRDTLHVLRVNAVACTIIGVMDIAFCYAVPLLTDSSPADGFSWWNFTVIELVAGLLSGLSTAALTFCALLTLGGIRPSLRDLVRGLSFAVPVTAICFILDLPTWCFTLLGAADPAGTQSLFPYFAAVITVFFLFLYWLVSIPAVVAEGLGIFAAFRRSAQLTGGHRWTVAGFTMLVGIAVWCSQFGLRMIGNVLSYEVQHFAANVAYWIADFVLPAAVLVFWAAAQASAYAALRPAKDGIAVQQLARVFD